MAEFYVTKEYVNDTDGHQVHKDNCDQLPTVETLLYLGSFATGQAAFNKGKGLYDPVSYCPSCLAQA